MWSRIQLNDAILYRLLYSRKNSTKESVAALINHNNNTFFSRQSFESKENNIPLSVYNNILHSLTHHNILLEVK